MGFECDCLTNQIFVPVPAGGIFHTVSAPLVHMIFLEIKASRIFRTGDSLAHYKYQGGPGKNQDASTIAIKIGKHC